MELLLIPVLLISGAALVYLGAGGGHPFNQQDPRSSTRSALNERAHELASTPSAASLAVGGRRLGADPYGETELFFESRSNLIAEQTEALDGQVAPISEEIVGSAPGDERDLARSRSNMLEPGPAVTAKVTERLAASPSASLQQLQPDVLLTDLLSELIEVRRDLKEVRGTVNALYDAQRRAPLSSDAGSAGAPLPAFKPARAEG